MIQRKNGSHKKISEILGSDRVGNFPNYLENPSHYAHRLSWERKTKYDEGNVSNCSHSLANMDGYECKDPQQGQQTLCLHSLCDTHIACHET